MKKYELVNVIDKESRSIRHMYHIPDVLEKFDRTSFVKNVRHAGAMSLFHSTFYTCDFMQKEAVEDMKKIFSVDNLTDEYYRNKKAENNESCIGFSLGCFVLKINKQRIWCTVQLAFEIRNHKPQFVISYHTNAEVLHLSKAIEKENIDEFIKEITERTEELVDQLKQLQKEYGKKQPNKKKVSKELIDILDKAPIYSMKELESACE